MNINSAPNTPSLTLPLTKEEGREGVCKTLDARRATRSARVPDARFLLQRFQKLDQRPFILIAETGLVLEVVAAEVVPPVDNEVWALTGR
ncbi:hypothetical protein BH20PSE1_BH20PSE1_20520 [soil metagenome]